ncbi:MAG: RelA/SpoT domain-containing protein [Verrucomicrobia bacterium]|nr:RelA/SpoT domain-containing protein [Verrucomicrobiota bacterium]
MSEAALRAKDKRRIEEAVERFNSIRHDFQHLAKTVHALVSEHPSLTPLIHSVKWRVKDVEHLRHKLVRKTLERNSAGARRRPDITASTVFDHIEDLAGVRILHLHTKQMEQIHAALLKILGDQMWVVKGPVASTWDDEYRQFFKSLGIETVSRDSLYTSVHYIISPNSKTPLKCELQVRTLAEEVWGEVSHTIDYPSHTKSIACREQLRVLARLSSGCIRLVDSIFESHKEHQGFEKVLGAFRRRGHPSRKQFQA